MMTICFNVAGVSFREREVAEVHVEFKRGRERPLPCVLRKEPTNRHDRKAVAVWCGIRHLGYVPRTIQHEVLEVMGRKTETQAVITSVGMSEPDGDGIRHIGVQVEIPLSV